jgi:hypothetical protein
VQDSIDVAEATIEEGKKTLLSAGQEYERWLSSGCVRLLRAACKLGKPLRAVKNYDYL